MEAKTLGEPTVRLCQLLRLLISHFLTGPRWCGYKTLHQDLESACLIKALKNVKNFREDRGKAFSYMTLVCQTACTDFLSKHYGHRNMIQEVRALRKDEWLGSVPEYVRSGKIPPPIPSCKGNGPKPQRAK